MKRKIMRVFLIVVIVGVGSPAFGLTYLGYEEWGGAWYDAEKTPGNTEDDLMCWAAAAANILAWTGWGFEAGPGFSSEDEIFRYYQDHWTDEGGWMYYGWDWWFDGTNDGPGWSNWSQVDVPGGGFWTEYTFSDYYYEQDRDDLALESIDGFLHNGYGVTLGVFRDGRSSGHAITVWGYDYEEVQEQITYKGLWVTDSDDGKDSNSPPNDLRYYDIVYSGSRWFLQKFYGKDDVMSNSWYIDKVQALDRKPGTGVTPEPATLFLIGIGLIGLLALFHRKREQ